MRSKASDLFNIVVDTDNYDFEQRAVTQDYDLKELKERPTQLTQETMKKGLETLGWNNLPLMMRKMDSLQVRIKGMGQTKCSIKVKPGIGGQDFS